jgi:LCP family protein required for cell wall assembly
VFEHLDDPQPFVASEGLRTAAVAAGGRLRRGRRRRLVGGGAAALVVVVLAGTWAYVDRRDAAIDRVEVATRPSSDGAVNILLLGDDGDLAGETGIEGSRVDTAVLLRIDDVGVRLLSIPRDLTVPGSSERFSLAAGGSLDVAVAEVAERVGDVPVDHVVRIGFDGFVALVDAVGGVPVRVTRFVVDEPTGTELEPSDSCQVLDGATALGLVRARHVAGDPTGDLGRTARQRALLVAVLERADVGDLDRLSRAVADHAVVDGDLGLEEMVDLGRRIASAPSVESVSLPVVGVRRADGAAVLELAAGAADVIAAFGATAPLDGSSSADLSQSPLPADPFDPGLAPC